MAPSLLEEMLPPDRPIWDKADEIKEVEHKCDFLTHEIIQRLQPHVRDAARSRGYLRARPLARRRDGRHRRVGSDRPALPDRHGAAGARELARIIRACDRAGGDGAESARAQKGVAEPAVEINRLENEADRAHQAAVRRLFEEEQDPITIIKWKEILDFLEDATDRCEDVANVLEGVVVKHA